ncbi:transcriptional repressor NrdR [Candidatus Gracilibacteria bacterium]|nr:transcriptional repressor NrdR [Candidatus Gracilibacteria bacterium]NJS41451.1 transcriptional repressor NrdR [Candidatus Gracilibacteria bacterium]
MNCPKCHYNNTKVYDTRTTQSGKVTRRRRQCLECKHRFTTVEEVKIFDLMVKKRNGQEVIFSEKKLEQGIRKAFNKRPVDNAKIAKLVQDVIEDVLQASKNPISSVKVGKLVLKNLEKVDKVAFICYSAMFSNFDSVDDFINLVRPKS